MRTSKEKPCCSALKIALYKKNPQPNKNDPWDFTTEKESRTIFSVQEKKTKYIVKQARGGQFSENKRDAKNHGVEWDVCMISKTYSSVLKLFWESLSLYVVIKA